MSDGPFACIQMRRGWRDLLTKADNYNFSPEELRRDLSVCLNSDWNAGMQPSLTAKIRRVMDEATQSSLFGNESVKALESLKNDAAGSAMAELAIECGIQALREGHAGSDGLIEATSNTLDEWLARSFRGVEEHCVNNNVDRARSLNVRARLQDAATGTTADIARQVLGLAKSNEQTTPSKQRGLDDGVPINGKR